MGDLDRVYRFSEHTTTSLQSYLYEELQHLGSGVSFEPISVVNELYEVTDEGKSQIQYTVRVSFNFTSPNEEEDTIELQTTWKELKESLKYNGQEDCLDQLKQVLQSDQGGEASENKAQRVRQGVQVLLESKTDFAFEYLSVKFASMRQGPYDDSMAQQDENYET